MRNRLIAAAAMAACAAPAIAASPACPPALAERADGATDGLTSWRAVADFYRRYRACDDGGIAEGSADAIAKLLAGRWASLGELRALDRRTPGLGGFVAAHVNSTLDTDDLRRIADHARGACPAGMAGFCRRLRQAAAEALR